VALRAHAPFAHVVLLLTVADVPFGAMVVRLWRQLPPAQVVAELVFQTPPRGPVVVPVWLVAKAGAETTASAAKRAVANFIAVSP
jgi:hypothetical protein